MQRDCVTLHFQPLVSTAEGLDGSPTSGDYKNLYVETHNLLRCYLACDITE